MEYVSMHRYSFKCIDEKIPGAFRPGYFLFCIFLICLSGDFLEAQRQTAIFEGIEIGFEMEHARPGNPVGEFMEGDHAFFRFTIRDTLTGEGISGASPGAWMEPAGKNSKGELYDCGQLVTSFLAGSMFSRAELDLNVFYVLTLNNDPTISVVDPLFGFGGTQLLALIELESPGMDWEVSPGQNHVFVSQPQVEKVAMISTTDWTVKKQIPLNARPYSMAIQPDGNYVWVEFRSGKIEGFSGIAAISTVDGSLMNSIPTGEGTHNFVISDDNQWVFVTNSKSRTVSVIEPNKLKKTADIEVEGVPDLIAWSSKAKAAYVVDKESGIITVIDGRSRQVITTVEGLKGASQIEFERTGRYAFLVYPDLDRMQILDAASNRIVQTGDTESRPTRFAFSDELAYLSHSNSETVLMVPLDQIGMEGTQIQAADFPGGQNPPGLSQMPCSGPRMVQAPGANAMLIANPADETVYYYLEGMAAPMGSFANYSRQPRSVAVIDRSLKEIKTGVYQTTARLRGAGPYRIAFFLDAPRILHCFDANIGVNPQLEAERKEEKLGTIALELYAEGAIATPGEDFEVFVKMTDPVSGELFAGLNDVRFRATSPSNWYEEIAAPETEKEGYYGAKFKFPGPGVYYIYAECPSRKLFFNNEQFLILRAK